jgi:hypothetical protein
MLNSPARAGRVVSTDSDSNHTSHDVAAYTLISFRMAGTERFQANRCGIESESHRHIPHLSISVTLVFEHCMGSPTRGSCCWCVVSSRQSALCASKFEKWEHCVLTVDYYQRGVECVDPHIQQTTSTTSCTARVHTWGVRERAERRLRNTYASTNVSIRFLLVLGHKASR